MKVSLTVKLVQSALALGCLTWSGLCVAQKGDLKKFCAKENIKSPAEKAWQRTSCPPSATQGAATPPNKDIYDEFFHRLTQKDWSGYEFPLNTDQIHELNRLESAAEYDENMPPPHSFSKVVDDLSSGKIPRAEAALGFLLSALEYTDASNAETVATGLGDGFENNPEQFIRALSNTSKSDTHALDSARWALDFTYTENAKELPPNLKSTALKLEKLPENKEIALFFKDLKDLP